MSALGGVCSGGCLLQGVSAPGGVCSRVGVCSQWVSAPGVSAQGDVVSQHALRPLRPVIRYSQATLEFFKYNIEFVEDKF